MYNSDIPSRAELPSSKQLLRSTLIAGVSAGVLLVTVVLPAEYNLDPTGVGRVLGLTQMGEIKVQLAAEAAADAAAAAAGTSSGAAPPLVPQSPQTTTPAAAPVAAPAASPLRTAWRDEQVFTLAPGQGIEIKLVMKEGAKAEYAWSVDGGGAVNFDTHGDGSGRSISYEKGRGVSKDEGVLTAAFAGNHGWYWRNRSQGKVAVVLRTSGDYSEIKRVE